MRFLNIVISRLVIIHDFHLSRAVCCPAETDPKLVVNANAMLALAFTLERFQSIARRSAQKAERFRRVKLGELANGDPGDRAEPPALSAFKQRLSVGATETADHSSHNITCIDTRQTRSL